MSDARVCVITGASGGIGEEVVKKYYKNGYDVVMLDIKEEALKALMEKEKFDPSRVIYKTVDVSSEEQVINTVSKIKEEKGRIDVLVNTAGIIGKYDETIKYTFDNFKENLRDKRIRNIPYDEICTACNGRTEEGSYRKLRFMLRYDRIHI